MTGLTLMDSLRSKVGVLATAMVMCIILLGGLPRCGGGAAHAGTLGTAAADGSPMTRHLRAIFAACLLMASLQPPGAMAADPIFRYSLHAGPHIDPPPNPGLSASLSYPGMGTLVSGTPMSSGEGVPSLTGLLPVSFTASGTLPSGLSLDPASGVISGQPAAAGIYSYTVTAVDASGNTATASLTTVTAGSIAYSLSPGAVGVAFTPATPTVLGLNRAAYSISGGALPPGLAIDGATGTISGTPTAEGAYIFSVTGTVNPGVYGTSPSYRLTIAGAPGSAKLIYPSDFMAMESDG